MSCASRRTGSRPSTKSTSATSRKTPQPASSSACLSGPGPSTSRSIAWRSRRTDLGQRQFAGAERDQSHFERDVDGGDATLSPEIWFAGFIRCTNWAYRKLPQQASKGRFITSLLKGEARMARSRYRNPRGETLEAAAGNGLIDRRALLGRGMVLAGAISAGVGPSSAGAEPLADQPWSLEVGDPMPLYQVPSKFEAKVARTLSNPNHELRNSHARTPHHLLEGTTTPNGLHFTINHGGIPDIDPEKHQLVIHGLVKRPLEFTLETLSRYPMTSRVSFLECGGNSAPMFSPEPMQETVQALHGLVSCAEWTGIKLSSLLEETGIDPAAKWLIAEGADSPHLSRSVPVKKALDDAMIVLYQNGERIMPGNGYPMRLLLPGYEGNMNVKFLRRIKLVEQPAMS